MEFSERPLLVFDCYSSPTPLNKRLGNFGTKEAKELIKPELQVAFGSERKWKEWEEAILKVLEHEPLYNAVITGLAPQPIFIYLGKKLGRFVGVDGFLNFNAQTQMLDYLPNTGIRQETIFDSVTLELSKPKENKKKRIQLFFSGSIPVGPPKAIDEEINTIVSFIPKKVPFDKSCIPQARHEIGTFIRSFGPDPNVEFSVVTSMPNFLNYCLGAVWPDNIVGPLVVYDFIKMEYVKVPLDF